MKTTKIFAMIVVLLAGTAMAGTVAQFGGTYSSWPTVWTPLLDDPTGDTGTSTADFYNGTDHAAYYAQDSSYIYFRVRINDSGTINFGDLHDSYFIFVDRLNWSSNGTADGFPDYSFSWDAKSSDNTRHGLEMQRFDPAYGTNLFNNLRMDDVDGQNGQKLTQDFDGLNGTARVGDGYIQTIDGAMGGGAFIEFAISWSYLTGYSTTSLAPGENWNIALGSVINATDHNAIDGDVTGWSGPITTVPEPATGWLAGAGLLAMFAILKRRRVAD